MRPRVKRGQFAAVLLATVAIMAALGASALGLFGGVVACGADNIPGCALWPMPISEAVWFAFVIGIAALVVWQVRT